MKPVLYFAVSFCFILSSAFFFYTDPSGITDWPQPQAADKTLQPKALPRIAIAGLAIESSTFSPALTQEEAFHAKVGDEIFTSIRFSLPTR